MFQPRNIIGAETATKPYYPAFDFLRAGAALGVFLSHAQFRDLLPHEFGNACVQVFFALSGFLIGGILLETRPKDLPKFYFNRTMRIWIPYWVAFTIIFALTAAKQGLGDSKFFEFFFYDLTFVYNWFGPPQLAEFRHRMPLEGTGNHFWSICVEEQFYLLAPLFLIFLPRVAAAVGLLALVAVNFWQPHHFAAISLGVIVALAGERRLVAGVMMACAGLVGALFFSYEQWMPFLSAAIVAACSWRGPQLPGGALLGGASYAFYLNGWIGLFIASSLERRMGLPSTVGFMLAISVSSLIALSHYQFIDREIMKRRGRYFSDRVGLVCCAAGFLLVASGVMGGVYFFR